MKTLLPIALLVVSALASGCRKSESAVPAAAGNGPRRIEVTVSNQGFTPPRVVGRPGEDLTLGFRYKMTNLGVSVGKIVDPCFYSDAFYYLVEAV